MAFVSNLGIAFHENARLHASRTALTYPATGETVTHGELGAMADQIAHVLWRKGLRQGAVVAMFHDKSPAAFAAMLACLRLGIVYSNLDPDSPWERVRKILAGCKPSAIINAFDVLPFATEFATENFAMTIDLRRLQDTGNLEPLPALESVCGSSPAYIMFTSGSTGTPKGAVMSHANLLWFIGWAQNRFQVTPNDVLTNVNPIYFDNSVFDFYTAVFSGACLAPIKHEQVRDTRVLVKAINTARCTIWFSVPSLLVYLLTTRALTAADFPSLRKFIFGGEGFPKSKLKQLYDLFGARVDLENVYGPTECTCICSAYTINSGDFDDMQNLAPLGSLSQNFDYEILPLDDNQPNFGELFLRGPHVGLGYYDDPVRTAKSFGQNPRHTLFSDIGYRTGDLVLRDESGRLHFKGRADFQIKHMGYRIELEEIEAALNTLSGVAECAVVYQKMGDGLGQILAYAASTVDLASDDLIAQIGKLVPAYMVPRRLTVMRSLPKNANGKIDRVALQTLATAQ